MDSSSTNDECLRSPLLANREAGVICSATQAGLRVLLSNAEVVERVGRRSEMGPGKPYWKRPEGFTGVIRSFLDKGIGTGAAGVGIVGVGMAAVGVGWSETLRSRRDEKNAAEAAAPVAADTPAMMAKVVFDILRMKPWEMSVGKENTSAFNEVLGRSRQANIRCFKALSPDDAPKVHETSLREPIVAMKETNCCTKLNLVSAGLIDKP